MAEDEFQKRQNQNETVTTVEAEARLRDNPVFVEAQALQREYADKRIHAKDADSFWWQNEEIARLNKTASDEKLLNERLTLSGEGVRMPDATMDILADSVRIVATENFKIKGDELEVVLSGRSIEGVFSGFGVRFNKAHEADMYTPVLTYRALVDRKRSPYLDLTRYAMGDVGVSTAVFKEDAFHDELDLLLENLRTLAPEDTEDIMKLAKALAATSTSAGNMASVGWKAKAILEEVNEDDAQILQDGLVDLIMHYLKKTPSFTIKTRAFLVSKSKTSPEEKLFVSNYGSPRAFQQSIQDAAFLDQYEMTKRGPRAIGQKVLHIILGESEGVRLAYIPVHELMKFSKA